MIAQPKVSKLIMEIVKFRREAINATSTEHVFERGQAYKTTKEALQICEAVYYKFRSKGITIKLDSVNLSIIIPL